MDWKQICHGTDRSQLSLSVSLLASVSFCKASPVFLLCQQPSLSCTSPHHAGLAGSDSLHLPPDGPALTTLWFKIVGEGSSPLSTPGLAGHCPSQGTSAHGLSVCLRLSQGLRGIHGNAHAVWAAGGLLWPFPPRRGHRGVRMTHISGIGRHVCLGV